MRVGQPLVQAALLHIARSLIVARCARIAKWPENGSYGIVKTFYPSVTKMRGCYEGLRREAYLLLAMSVDSL